MKKVLSFLLCAIVALSAVAQKKSVTGTVTLEGGEPVVGASVIEVGTTNGTMTDIDGAFTISVAENASINVSYIGCIAQKISVKGKSHITVVLKEDAQVLEEVVITGYGGKQKKAKVTNSIARVNDDALKVGVFSNPGQALTGSVAGLKVTNTSGNPGSTPSIVLRGGTNLDGSGSPLVIVDGQLRGGLNDLNPEDIESIDVLKDAGATALYGARASNGVILVTTKSGKKGHSEINVKVKLGINYMNNPYEFLGAADYITALRTAYVNTPWASTASLSGAQPYGTGNVYNEKMKWNLMQKTDDNAYLLGKGWKEMKDPISDATLIYKETDIQSFNFNNPSLTQDYNINMSGGNEHGSYYAGLGYNHSEGLPVTSFYKRYNMTFNGSYNIAKWLTSTTNFSFNRANWQSMPGSQGSEANYFGRLISVPPTARYEDEDGNQMLGPSAGDGNQDYQDEKFVQDNQSDKFTMIQSFDIKFLDCLSLKLTGNWYYSEAVNESFTKDYENQVGVWNRTRSSSSSFNRTFDQTYNAVLNYNQSFAEKHNVDVMLGGEFYDSYYRYLYAAGSGAPTDAFGDLQYTSTDEGKRSIDTSHSKIRIASTFGRLNYDYLSKYLFSAVFRYDGYSSLLGDNRWGFFPGVSAGWVFSNEDFIRDKYNWLSYGKLRSSFGINGNASGIGAYTLQGNYGSTTYNGNTGFLIGTLPNPALRWEKTRTFEIGLDLGFLNNRLNANFTYYNRLTSDKYAALSLPSTTGFSSITNNNGKYSNKGLEVELNGKIVKMKDFSWDVTANISYNINKVVALPYNKLPNNRQGGTEIYTGRKLDDGTYETTYVGGYQEGQEPNQLIGYVFEGIYKSWDEIPGDLVDMSGSNAANKRLYGPDAWNALSDAEKKNALQLMPGDAKFKDINGDGIIDNKDRAVIGNMTPRWTGGLTTTLRYKGFSLLGRFDFALGFWTYDQATPWFLGCMQGTFNTTKDYFNTWSETNVDAKYPRYVWADQLGTANYYRSSTLFAYRGNYLAIRELSLAYSLPTSLVNKFHCKGLDLSVTGQNLGYIKSAPIATPESAKGTGIASGIGYGLPRILLFGANIKF